MTISMTGFAAAKGQGAGAGWSWDLRAVNGKGLDLRLRVPDWIDGLELALRGELGRALSRGNVSLTLRVSRDSVESEALHLNPGVLRAVLEALAQIEAEAMRTGMTLAQPSHADVLGFRGVIETTQAFLPLLKKSDAGRIANVSSLLGSISEHQNPESFIYEFKGVPAYNVSKSAVNAWTVHLAHELKDSGIKVNTIHPGYVKTDMNKAGDVQNGELDVADGARTSVRLALIDSDGPTGGYYYFDQVLPW